MMGSEGDWGGDLGRLGDVWRSWGESCELGKGEVAKEPDALDAFRPGATTEGMRVPGEISRALL